MARSQLSRVPPLLVLVVVVACADARDTEPDSVSSAVDGGACSTAFLPVSLCQRLDDSGIVSARCPIDVCTLEYRAPGGGGCNVVFADPDDACDDTPGLRTALQRARARKRKVLLTPEKNPAPPLTTYLISEPLDVSGTHLYGEAPALNPTAGGVRIGLTAGTDLVASSSCTTFTTNGTGFEAIASPAQTCRSGAMLYATGAGARVEGITLQTSAGTAADFGFFAHGSSDLRLGIEARGARKAGMLVEDSAGTVRGAATVGAGHGLVLVSSAAMASAYAGSNGGHGVVVTSRSGTASRLTPVPVTLGDFTSERNGGGSGTCASAQGLGYGVYVRDVVGNVVVKHVWLENGAALGGLRAQNAQNVHVQLARSFGACTAGLPDPDFPGEPLAHSFAFVDCKHCSLRTSHTSDGAVGAFAGAHDFWIEGSAQYNYVDTYIYSSSLTTHAPGGPDGQLDLKLVTRAAARLLRRCVCRSISCTKRG